ncbi:NAC domain-containing protein 41-like [Cornus florida]|uniref:NAC domain-containing protein 41-like n=1 Tax=Cornus florida TaxID=4283 RepID=UPI0028A2B0DA|nr:NAC domain-containing protein 41-like [Cornus florida]
MFVPLGFRFIPTEEELLTHFLRRKLKQESLPYEGVILERDVYGEAPWNIFTAEDPWHSLKSNEFVIYVFTQLKKIDREKKRIVRRAGCGTWDGQTGIKNIYNKERELIGFNKMLSFEVDVKKDEFLIMPKGHWTMHEYSLGGVSLNGLEEGTHDYVVCKIKRDDSKHLKRAPKHHAHEVSKEENPRCRKKMRYDHGEVSTTPQNIDQSVSAVTIMDSHPDQLLPPKLPNNTPFDIQPLPTHDDDETATVFDLSNITINSCDMQQIDSFFDNLDATATSNNQPLLPHDDGATHAYTIAAEDSFLEDTDPEMQEQLNALSEFLMNDDETSLSVGNIDQIQENFWLY